MFELVIGGLIAVFGVVVGGIWLVGRAIDRALGNR